MPYPYNNDLGKKIPNDAFSPAPMPFPIWKEPKKKAPDWASKPLTQAEMLEQLFGAKPGTLKFPKVLPLATTKDYPGSHPANKWGKPDPTMIADDKVDTPKGNWAELVDAELKAMEKKYPSHLYNDVVGNLSAAHVDPAYYQKPELPKPTTMEKLGPMLAEVYGFPLHQKPAPQFLGKMMNDYDYQTHSNKITIKLRVDGLSVDNITFGVSHKIADHAAFNMNTDMLSHVLDEALAKLKDEIMRKVIMEATKK